MAKSRKGKAQAEGQAEKNLWDPPFRAEAPAFTEKGLRKGVYGMLPFCGVNDKEIGSNDIWMAIQNTEAIIVGIAMDLDRHFENSKAAIQARPPPDIAPLLRGKKQPVSNGFLPLNFSIDREKDGLRLRWHEHHVQWITQKDGNRKRNKYKKALAKTLTLKDGIEQIHKSLLKNHSHEGVDQIPEGMTREEAYAWRDLVYETEARAYFLRRTWRALRTLKKTFQSLRYHTRALQTSGGFEPVSHNEVVYELSGNTPEQVDIFAAK